jgi:hypothetical protein
MVRMDDQRSIDALTQHVDLYCAQLSAGERQHKRVMFGPPAIAPLRCALKARIPTACACSPARLAIFSPQTRPPTACATTGKTAARLSARSIPRAWARAGGG